VVRAVVLPAAQAPLELGEIDLPEPGPGRVRVRLAAAGVCHSDLSLSNGTLRQPVPAVLGHEGAGTVTAVGEGVTTVAPGDEVVLNWAPSCGSCHFCARLGEPWLCTEANAASGVPYARSADGRDLYPGLGTAAFAEETVVAERGVLPLPDGVPLADAALLGCAVLTGYGAVNHSARVREGESVAVFGVGGVGADAAVECVGRAETIRAAWSSTRRGGRTSVVGIGGKDTQVSFSPLEIFHFARTLSGCVYGNCVPVRDLPVLAGHVRSGRLDLGTLVTDRIGLEDVPAAFEAMLAGRGGRALVVF
jgi:S-(hydroxymethyl)glutathione dehydrogenase/alcohol dehydrogenase